MACLRTRKLLSVFCALVALSASAHLSSAQSADDSQVTVPDVTGLTAADAKRALNLKGLVGKFQVGQAASAESDAFHVYALQPVAQTPVPRGSEILVTIYAAATSAKPATALVPPTVPAASPQTPPLMPSPTAPPPTMPPPAVVGKSALSAPPPIWIGVSFLPLSEAERIGLRIETTKGATVVGVFPDSPAAAAGLALGDVVTAVDGKPVDSAGDLVRLLASRKSGAAVSEFDVRRGAKTYIVPLETQPFPLDLYTKILPLAEAGYAWAQYEVAGRLHSGAGVKADPKNARRWMQTAADQGLAAAQLGCARMLLDGFGGPVDVPSARQLLEKASMQGLTDAQFTLGRLCFEGDRIGRDFATAGKWLSLAAESGHGMSAYYLGCVFAAVTPPQFAEARKRLEQAAALGVTQAHVKLGLMNLYGEGVEPNQEEALAHMLKAVQAGDVPAKYELAVFWREGVGIEPDAQMAQALFRSAANQGEPRAQNELGLIYSSGTGVTADPKEAEYWFRRAAESGNAVAEFNLALLFEQNGNSAEALQWYRKAAEHGVDEARYRVGVRYAEGNGVNRDLRQALKWIIPAARNGHSGAAEKLRKLVAEVQLTEPRVGRIDEKGTSP